MGFIAVPTLLCDGCGKPINEGTKVDALYTVTYNGYNKGGDAFSTRGLEAWPLWKEVGTIPDTKYFHHDKDCLKEYR